MVGCGDVPVVKRGVFPVPQDALVVDAEGRYGGQFILSGADEPKSFNFLVSTDATSSHTQSYLLSGLVEYNPVSLKHEPALAKSWNISEDKLRYRFELRRGIRWSDGVPFTADDVIFTFDCIFAKNADGSYRYPNRYIDQYTISDLPLKYEKIDTYTVEFETPKPYAPFINDIGFVAILPKHKLLKSYEDGTLLEAWSLQTAIENPDEIVGTGPFTLEVYRPSEYILLKANPHYWKVDKKGQRLPYIDFLVGQFVSDMKTQVLLFATGQTDASNIPASEVIWVKEEGRLYDFTVYDRGPDAGIWFLWFNQNTENNSEGISYIQPHKLKWFRNKIFRQALLYGTNRAGLIDSVFLGKAKPIHSIIAEANVKWHSSAVRKYDYDPALAKKLLKKAGFFKKEKKLFDPNGNRVKFTLMVNDGSQLSTSIATAFKENMADLGIKVKIQFIDFGTMIDRVHSSYNYDACMMGFTGGGDPSGGKSIYRSDGSMHLWHLGQKEPATPWEAKIDALMDQQEIEFNEAKRVQLVAEIQSIFSEELPLLFLNAPNRYTGIRKKWQNVKVPPMASILWNIDSIYLKGKDK